MNLDAAEDKSLKCDSFKRKATTTWDSLAVDLVLRRSVKFMFADKAWHKDYPNEAIYCISRG